MVPAMQERDAGISEARRPPRRSRVRSHWVQIRHNAGYGRPRSVREQDRGSVSAGGVATERVKQRFGGIEGLPTTMPYDRQGILRTKVIGFEYTDNIESALKPLL